MKTDNIEILVETLRLLNQGYYNVNGKTVELQLSKEQMEFSRVLLPEEIHSICNGSFVNQFKERCKVDCVKLDSFAAAIQMGKKRRAAGKDVKPILVLNFANPVNIGGGVYKGASAQEEDLCRRSSLLKSLENSKAFPYYNYNRNLHTHMGSDAVIISPEVEIIRDEYGNCLEETTVVSVLTCAAPMISYGLEGLTEREYLDMFYYRITGILDCAAYLGYEDLVLGAWGCGAFGNNAKVVSDLFYTALCKRREGMFREIVFAVRSGNTNTYNFTEFYRNFGKDNWDRD